ncbi:MAG: DUF362 domain-containing protein [Euryarchaeota archaeon]|nr:DUF362 domain-containing protein [Euryarchaeota archaeon]
MRRRALLTAAALLGSALAYRYLYPLRYFLSTGDVVEEEGAVPPRRSRRVAGPSKVSVVEVRGSVRDAVRAAVDALGGFESLQVEGREVLVKPNVNSDDPYPATTNPELVRSTVELLYDAGARRVVVGDMSGVYWLPTRRSMEKSGIAEAAEAAGAELAFFEEERWIRVRLPGDTYLGQVFIPLRVHRAEVIVSLPVVKTHRYATYSMSLKNLVGVISGADRRRLHTSSHMEEMIAEISLAVYPDLIVMDGTRSMVAGGPTSGVVRDTRIILAGTDQVAVDVAGLGVVRSFGEWEPVLSRSVWQQRQIARAVALRLGAANAGEVQIETQGSSSRFAALARAIEDAVAG